jgi:RNA polymerase sigma factor (sigma-70 family)
MFDSTATVSTERALSATLSGHPMTAPTPPDFDRFYLDHFTPMVRLAFVLVDTVEQAEEVVQEAFTKLLPRFERLGDPEGYLRVSVLNGARAVLRRRRVARAKPAPLDERGVAPLGDDIIDAVRRLREPQRSAVILRYYLDLSESEIAETLRMRPGTVKSTLSRARDQLREVLR